MDFLIHRDDLTRALTRVQGIVEKRSTTPILSTVLLEARDGQVRMTATDKAMTFIGEFAATVSVPGNIAVDAIHFFQIAKVLPADVVSIRLMENQRVEVRCGRSLYKLNGFSAADFPPTAPPETGPVMKITASNLRRIIDQTASSIASDDNRYGLNGAHVENVVTGDGQTMVRFVGTDGSRLSWSQAPYTGELKIGQKMLLPRKPLSELRKLLESLEAEVEFGFGDRAAVVRFPGVTLYMRLLEADFPNYRDVLPSWFKRKVVLDRAVFQEGLRRVAVLATPPTYAARFAFAGDGLVMSARSTDVGEAREEIAADFSGEPIAMAFNVRFIQDVLGVISGSRISIELGDQLAPCLMRDQDDGNALFVVMPVRLD